MNVGDVYLLMTVVVFVIAIPAVIWIKHENKNHKH